VAEDKIVAIITYTVG